jgi:hypothetical protein
VSKVVIGIISCLFVCVFYFGTHHRRIASVVGIDIVFRLSDFHRNDNKVIFLFSFVSFLFDFILDELVAGISERIFGISSISYARTVLLMSWAEL